MIKNYFRVAIRNLIRHKGFTLINIFGLASSMAICLLIILFIIDQDRMDEYHQDADRIYRVITEFEDETRGRTVAYATTPYELNQILQYNVSDVTDASQLVKGTGTIKFNDRIFGYSGLYVSPNFLDFFHFDLLKGNKSQALLNSRSVIISHELAENLFQQKDAIGQLVSIDDVGSFTVTGIIENKNIKTHIEFDLLLPNAAFADQPSNKILLTDWDAGFKHFYNYVKIKEDASSDRLLAQLKELDLKFSPEKKELYGFNIQRLDEINLGRLVRNEIGLTTPILIAYFFGVLALVLILSACFNYMNLSIARSLKRAKEVGVRKVIGASKMQIITPFRLK